MRRTIFGGAGTCVLVAFISCGACGAEGVQGKEPEPVVRETVLDWIVSLEKDLILEIPQVPPLCEKFEGEKRNVDVGECKLYCEVEGEGMPIVLLHGGPGATHHYFHPHFSRAKGFAKVIYYDQRGCGVSEYKRGSGYSLNQAADDLDNLRKALKIDRWVVLGHSYGGALAQYYAVRHPEKLAGLVLVCASPAAPIELARTRQYDFLSGEEAGRIASIHGNRSLTMAQRVYNAFLNGDWKRQEFYKPSREKVAQMALYEWKHDPEFRSCVGQEVYQLDLRGAFDACPIPTLILEARWDLTWNTDKPRKLQAMHPRSKLVIFERSGHSPFADEPEQFFQALHQFVRDLPSVSEADVAKWKQLVADCQKKQEQSLEYVVRHSSWGRESNARIVKALSMKQIDQLNDTLVLLKVGFALYDYERYEDALTVFRKLEGAMGGGRNAAVALIWQGHMLDLLGRREEAVAVYKKVAEMKANGVMQHSQFGLSYSPSPYAAERIKTPFVRVENQRQD